MPSSGPLRVRANAKLNLGLRVLGRRADGFHELDALTIAVTEPHDVLFVSERQEGPGVHLEVGGPAEAGVPADSSNLVVAAARRLLAGGASAVGVDLVLHKRIPAGAGLGGGSADAAAALVAVDRLLRLETPSATIESIGAELGSDVPFCLRTGAARMTGRGDVLEAAESPALRMLIAVPPQRCSTPQVYRAWDELGGPSGRAIEGPASVGHAVMRNDLEPAAWAIQPELAEFRSRLESECARPALMAGSGSAYVVLYDEDETPGRAVVAVRERTGAQVFAAGVAPAVVADA